MYITLSIRLSFSRSMSLFFALCLYVSLPLLLSLRLFLYIPVSISISTSPFLSIFLCLYLRLSLPLPQPIPHQHHPSFQWSLGSAPHGLRWLSICTPSLIWKLGSFIGHHGTLASVLPRCCFQTAGSARWYVRRRCCSDISSKHGLRLYFWLWRWTFISRSCTDRRQPLFV